MMFSRIAASMFVIVFALVASNQAKAEITEKDIRTLYSGAKYGQVKLSPSGKYLSMIAGDRNDRKLVVFDRETMNVTVSVDYKDKGVSSYQWFDDERIYYRVAREDKFADSFFATAEVFILKADGTKNDRIWAGFGYEDNRKGTGKHTRGWLSPLWVAEEDGKYWLAFIRAKRTDGAGTGAVYRVNISRGDTNREFSVPEYTQSVATNKAGDVFLATVTDRSFEDTYLYKDGRGTEPFVAVPAPSIAAKGGNYSIWAVRERNLIGTAQTSGYPNAARNIISYNIDSGEWKILAEIPFGDVYSYTLEKNGELSSYQLVSVDEPQVNVVKKTRRAMVLKALSSSFKGFVVSEESITDDESMALYRVSSNESLGEYLLFDFETKQATSVLSLVNEFSEYQFAKTENLIYKASDGVDVQGWFVSPKGVEKPPLVVFIHGGPHGPYNQYGFDIRYQLLAKMGYAVFAPNFRGSGGYGKNFETAGYGKWGTRMIDDMADGVKYLIAEGRVDGDKVCTYGASYGGYGSAQSMVRHNDLYSCGVVNVGIFDMETHKKRSDTRGWYAGKSFMNKALGSSAEELRRQSPIHNVDQLKGPLLLLHGKKDKRTPFKGVKDFVKVLDSVGAEYEYKWYTMEGHGNAGMKNRVDEWLRVQKFLNKNLGKSS